MASNTLMSCGIATTAFPSVLSSSKSKFATSAVQLPSVGANASSRFSMSADWMPGQPRPPYLDGSAPGDFGFDPLRLGEVPENLERFKESELIHCRWAMLAVPGILVPEALGLGNWVKAQEWAAVPGGQATYLGNPVPWGTLPTILVIEFLSIAFVEHQRSMEKDPEKKKYPGGAFDPWATPRTLRSLRNTKSRRSKTAGSHCWLLLVSLFNNRRTLAPDLWRIWPLTWLTHGTTTLGTSLSQRGFCLDYLMQSFDLHPL
ncbi:photosystem I light harvesting complex gene 1 [Prunus dulcis]|uniref:Chlorophyll a-b binding protein, chloroplastic n=1 Tax=Prunus dulcis TaxID=3755 RepID=A0A4Y1S0D3_PRUDU|nr:photosystem I light harvesting complex gene 1 [Prunus dulcis]